LCFLLLIKENLFACWGTPAGPPGPDKCADALRPALAPRKGAKERDEKAGEGLLLRKLLFWRAKEGEFSPLFTSKF